MRGGMLSSKDNPKVKQAVRLRNKRDRDKTGLFLIEGYRELYHAIFHGKVEIEHLFYCPEFFLGTNEDTLLREVNALETSKAVFEKLSYRDRPDGLLAVAKQMKTKLHDLKKTDRLIVCEAIEKPGNLGTILRSSDAAGIDAVIIADPLTDIYNPNVVRASIGTLFTQPVVEASNQETLAFLKKIGAQIIAATPQAEHEFTEITYKTPWAIAVGTEQLGLSEAWMAFDQVKIPMHGVANSLNVATATTLMMYEAIRR